MSVIHRQKCRICGGELTKILDLGEQCLQGLFVKEGYPLPPTRKVPLELMWCDKQKNESACGLVQLSKTISQDIQYSTYWYRSATSTTMKNHLKSIVDKVIDTLTEKEQYYVLDIGANDCTMLSYYPKYFIRYAVDPSNALFDNKDSSIIKIKDVFPTNQLINKKFDVITSIAMLYDLENPIDFVYNINELLNDDGIWIFEISYLPTMMKQLAFDTVCFEHLEYYSLHVIEKMLDLCELKLIDVSLNDTNGGSIQCMAAKKPCGVYTKNEKMINQLKVSEFDMGSDTIEPYNKFADKVNSFIDNLQELIFGLYNKDKVIHLCGSSTKGNTLLQACGFDNSVIPYASERNPDKFGASTLGTNIKIISEEESRKMKPDYYLVLPWHFKKEILEREKETILNGSNFIFPLPQLEIITKDNINEIWDNL